MESGLLRFAPIRLVILLVLGIVVEDLWHPDITLSLGLCLIAFIVSTCFFIRKGSSYLFDVSIYITVVAIGIFSASITRPENQKLHYIHHFTQGDHLWELNIREVLKPNDYSQQYIAVTQGVDGSKASGKLLLTIGLDSLTKPLEVDNTIVLKTYITEINAPLNPHQFNFKKYMEGLGVYHQIKTSSEAYIQVYDASTTIYGLAAEIRKIIITALQKANFGTQELGVIQALLLGQRDDISSELYKQYINAGAVHILAVSGLHIGILLLLLQFVLKPITYLPKGNTIKLCVIVCILWVFAVIAGLSASVVRAVTMFSFVAYAQYLNRPSNTFNILALSMLFILLALNPLLIFQVGFQMSYAAVFAIVWIYPLLQQLWAPKNIFVKKVWQLLSVSFAAQLGVLPISLFYFHQFSGLFLISNLIIVPFLGLILGFGIIVIILALLNVLPQALAISYNSLIAAMNAVVKWVAAQESFVLENIPFDSVQLILIYFVIIFGIKSIIQPKFKNIALVLAPVLGLQLWALYADFNQKPEVVIMHQTANTVMVFKSQQLLKVYANDTLKSDNMIRNYAIGEKIKTLINMPLDNAYDILTKKFIIIDSNATYLPNLNEIDYLLLSQSPKLNLERLIDSLRPRRIIADGSNYKSVILNWQKTCAQKQVPFHYTGVDGAYIITLENQ